MVYLLMILNSFKLGAAITHFILKNIYKKNSDKLYKNKYILKNYGKTNFRPNNQIFQVDLALKAWMDFRCFKRNPTGRSHRSKNVKTN